MKLSCFLLKMKKGNLILLKGYYKNLYSNLMGINLFQKKIIIYIILVDCSFLLEL